MIHPSLNRVTIFAQFRDVEFAAPTVIPHRFHPRLQPAGPAFVAELQNHRQRIVPVGKNVRLDHHLFAGNPLDGITPGVDLRNHALDQHTTSAVTHG